ncbi:MAG TPA: hypothetical protein VF452_14535 [Candidatus Binatia bacterium]
MFGRTEKIAFILLLLVYSPPAGAGDRSLNASVVPRANSKEAELTRARNEVLQKMRETREGAEKLLALHESARQRSAAEYERRRELYYQGLISRNEVLQAEQVFVQAINRVVEDKRWLAESDMALTEFTMRDELLRLPRLSTGGYSETGSLIRFNGAAPWGLPDAPIIEKFFLNTFGRALPISALGQSATHERLRFDHRNAMDVALHPDSKEGQSLLSYLRQAGIPFIAFRSAVPGAATGAHIHIGKPSPRG